MKTAVYNKLAMDDAELALEQKLPNSMTFVKLHQIELELLAGSVTKQAALRICDASINDRSVKVVEVFSLWLRKLLRAYITETVDSNDYLQVFKELYAWLQRLRTPGITHDDEDCSDFGILLDDALEFAIWAQDPLLKAGESLVHAVSFFLLGIVHCYISFQNEGVGCGPMDYMSKAINLHLVLLSQLKEVTKRSVKVHARIKHLIQQLCEISHLLWQRMVHMHACIKTSKTITYMCAHYCRLNKSLGTTPNWLKETLFHLCDTVLNHIEIICKEKAIKVPMEKIEEYLKMIQAYLIMLQHIFKTGLKHMEECVLETILELLMGGKSKLKHNLGNDVQHLLSKYVRAHILVLFESIYQLEDFQKYMLTSIGDPEVTVDDYFELCLDFVTVAIMDDAKLTLHTCQTLEKIFEFMFKDTSQFINLTHYDRLIETYGSLLHVADSLHLCNYFCASVFQQDAIKSQASADVLLLCFRLEEVNQCWSSSVLMQATNYWMQCNNSYAIFSNNVSRCHVQRMVKYFLGVGNATELPVFSLNNYRYLYCVPPGNIDAMLLVERVLQLSKAPFRTTQIYYEMIALMELLAMQDVKSNNFAWLPQLLSNTNELLSSEQCTRFVNALAKLGMQASPALQYNILQKLSCSAYANSWYFHNFARICKGSHDPRLQSLAASVCAQNNGCYQKYILIEAMSKPQQPSSIIEVDLANIYSKLYYTRSQTHRCSTRSLKRKRDANTAKCIIHELYEKSLQLDESLALDEDDNERLRSIVTNLTKFVNHS